MSKSPLPTAVALTYDQESAPFVSATGQGLLAEEIIRIAKENGVLIHEDPVLVETLAQLELGQEIPEALYRAIAEVIAFAYSLRPEKEAELTREEVFGLSSEVKPVNSAPVPDLTKRR